MWMVHSSSSEPLPLFLEIPNPSVDIVNADLGKAFASVWVSVNVAPNLGGEGRSAGARQRPSTILPLTLMVKVSRMSTERLRRYTDSRNRHATNLSPCALVHHGQPLLGFDRRPPVFPDASLHHRIPSPSASGRGPSWDRDVPSSIPCRRSLRAGTSSIVACISCFNCLKSEALDIARGLAHRRTYLWGRQDVVPVNDFPSSGCLLVCEAAACRIPINLISCRFSLYLSTAGVVIDHHLQMPGHAGLSHTLLPIASRLHAVPATICEACLAAAPYESS